MSISKEQQLEYLLETLGAKYGYCIEHKVVSRLVKFPPKMPENFLNSVIEAEGLAVDDIEKQSYADMLSEVKKIYERLFQTNT